MDKTTAEVQPAYGEAIRLRKVSVNNLKGIDLDIPYGRLTTFCGLSGSGKSSLAIDTLYAEGQRRYIESFSAYTRQFLEKLEKPEAELIDGIQPAIAVTSRPSSSMSRSTVATATETADYLRLLFSKVGRLHCHSCGRRVRCDSPDSVLESLESVAEGTRLILAFSPSVESFRARPADFQAHWRERGYLRGVVLGESFRLDEGGIPFDKFAEAQLLFLADQLDESFVEPDTKKEYFDPKTAASADDDFSDDAETDEIDDTNDTKSNNAEQTDEPEEPDDLADLPQAQDETDEANEPDETDDGELADTVLADGGDDTGDDAGGEDNSDESQLEKKFSNRILTIDPDGDAHLANYVKRRNESLKPGGPPPLFFVVDRLTIGKTTPARIRESLETAFSAGEGRCWIFCEGETVPLRAANVDAENGDTQNGDSDAPSCDKSSCENPSCENPSCDNPLCETHGRDNRRLGVAYTIDEARWTLVGFSRRLRCEDCGLEYPKPEPKLFSFNSPLGACPLCEGFGNLMTLELEKIIPDRRKSLRDGAVSPWNSPSYRHKYRELLAVADTLELRTDVPVSELTKREMDLLINGSVRTGFDGLNGFFRRLQKQKYKMHIRVFLSRWRSYRVCPLCHGARLRPEALAITVGGRNIDELMSMTIAEALEFFRAWRPNEWEARIGRTVIAQVRHRLEYMALVGLGYLTLKRQMRTLSEGEQRRVALTSVLGSSLVDMLYVLDEPSIGLHPRDTERLLESILALRDRGNTVVAVEHEEAILAASDRIVEIGPEAGLGGGRVVFEGTFDEICRDEKSLTGSYLSGRRGVTLGGKRRILEHGFLELTGAKGYNLKNVSAVFPLGVLCVVTGVSGAGKSTLVQETLYPAVCRKLGRTNTPAPLPFDSILGVGQIDDVVLVDQSPIGRSPRSNPITYLKIFDEIRSIFAETPDAKAKGYNAGYFSFNVDGGRCNACKGEGFLTIDLQFMADMYIKCPQCGGRRYQREILDILYRGRSIAEVLDMTVREAFSFFRGQAKVQQKLKRLMDVGLDYIRLGQPANTLSGGESQRLKLAAYLSNARKGRCLFIMDEPTTGLHFADIVQLLDGFDALVETGHSLIVVEHNLQMIKAADYIIDMGPGAADAGGQIVAEGTPEQIARNENSETGRFLKWKMEN